MTYRNRMYDAHISTLWKYTHSLQPQEYEQLRDTYRRRLSSYLPTDKNARIMDLACGAGHFLYFLQKEGYGSARGIDASAESIELARAMGVAGVAVGDLFELLQRHDQEFDFISANDILEHLRKDEVLQLLDLIRAALKPGGTVLIMVPNAGSLFGARRVFVDFTHETGFTSESLGQVLRVVGFERVTVHGEEPVVHSFGSAARAMVWKASKLAMKAYLLAEGTIGVGLWKRDLVLEARMFVVGRKPDG